MGFGESKLRRIRKTGHAFRPVAAAQDDAIPILMYFRRGIAQIGDRAILHPSAAAVDEGRVATFAVKRYVKFFALADSFGTGFELRRFRHGWNFNVRSRKGNFAAKFEGIQAIWAALGFGCGHGARGSKEARSGTPAHRSNHILFAVHRKRDGYGIDRGLRLHGPEFFSGVRGIGRKFAGALSLKNQVAGRGAPDRFLLLPLRLLCRSGGPWMEYRPAL